MILSQNKGSVAEWPFEDGDVQKLTWPTLERSVIACDSVTSILRMHRLLFPNIIHLSQWMRAGEFDVAQSERIEKNDIVVNIDPSESIRSIFPLCRSLLEKESVYPLTIKIFGSGVIFTDLGDDFVEDLVWVRASTLEIFRISVATQSDIWLPFSLKAEPQHNLSMLNADRLANALEEITHQTGFKLEEGIESYYSIIKGFRIYNIRYADGSIAEVI